MREFTDAAMRRRFFDNLQDVVQSRGGASNGRVAHV